MATITEKGLEAMARFIGGVSPLDPFIYLGNGSGSAAEDASDTALESENTLYGAGRAAATCRFIAPDTIQWSLFLEFTGDVVLREIGVFNALSGGDMFLRLLLDQDYTYGSSDEVELIVTHQMTQ